MPSAASASSRPSVPIRPSLSHFQPGAPTTPRTPNRALSSTFSSPAGARSEDVYVVMEIGARFLRAGFAGEFSPRCSIGFGPSEQYRAGDYRQWEPETRNGQPKRKQGEQWSSAYELWRMDLRGLDLGLVEDKVERAVRQIFTKYLLMDSKSRRIVLVLPPALPHALLSVLLTTLFSNFQCLSINLLSSPVCTTIAAGLRSALVVDIGWSETVVTGVYEYREVNCNRSVRAGKVLAHEMGRFLSRKVRKTSQRHEAQEVPGTADETPIELSFDEAEDVLSRVGWCRDIKEARRVWESSRESQKAASEEGGGARSHHTGPTISVRLQSTHPPTVLEVPFSELADPIEEVLFPYDENDVGGFDDEEQPLPYLISTALLSLPLDARGACMTRIIVTGGCSHIPGLKKRVVDEVAAIVESEGWSRLPRRKPRAATEAPGNSLDEINNSLSSKQPSNDKALTERDINLPGLSPASSAEQETDHITQELQRQQAKGAKPYPHGIFRGVESLGSWTGASLLASLKIKSTVEVEKDKFLQQGLAGASRDRQVGTEQGKTASGPGASKGNAGDRSSWTLGVWA